MKLIVKFVPLLVAWSVLALVMARGFTGRRRAVASGGISGFAVGVAGALLLIHSLRGELPFAVLRMLVGGGFCLFWGAAVAGVYRCGNREWSLHGPGGIMEKPRVAAVTSFLAAAVVGAICACRLPEPSGLVPTVAAPALLVLAGSYLLLLALIAEKFIPPVPAVTWTTLPAAVVAVILFAASCIPRLDLFSPLTMKVMKFIHDFVHQLFESMLIPDHPFFRPHVWQYIGFLFGSGAGFWGGLVIWFVPVLLVILAVRLERLPSVAHIRQGARRRTLLAAHLRERRWRLVIPGTAMVLLAAAVYQSRFPDVEYWDPKPLPVTARPSGEIFLPLKGEVDLEDGRLHKFIHRQEGREARFLVLMTPAGHLTVTLDACAICKPEGYGQTEGSVICYYCKTLIPLDTVGRPGGCNPVPVPFAARKDGVSIDGMALLNSWANTVQAMVRIKGEGK
jgi:uncharacterized membrane protein